MPTPQRITQLQQAHAAYIESTYIQLAQLPQNPHGIEIRQIGRSRLYLCNQHSFKNRAILTGNETREELREILHIFEQKGVTTYIELNPANFYRSEPFSWQSEMLPALLELGCFPSDFRCVWYLDQPPDDDDKPATIRRFTSESAAEFAPLKLQVEPPENQTLEQATQQILTEFTADWHNYIGFEENQPVSTSQLFIKNHIGYLAWGYTQPAHRRRGHHRAHAIARCTDTFNAGCHTAFSVTDFGIPSSLSLQKLGFKLAYNYLLLVKSSIANK